MAIGPRVEDIPRIRLALGFYRVSAAITGVFLLLLVVMMIVRYGFGSDLAIGWPGQGPIYMGPRDLTPGDDPTSDWPPGVVNLSTIILIIHGWFYVVYLLIDFIMWRLVRYCACQYINRETLGYSRFPGDPVFCERSRVSWGMGT